jgi:cold shock CspA family protein
MSNTQNDTNVTPASGASRQLGIVKWFNNKAGFGFVTMLGDESTDVFVHHSGVSVDREQYKYLVQGEYVEFNLSKSENNDHEWQAINVSGVQKGPLMCETRFLNKQERTESDAVRQRGSGPRDNGRGRGRNRDGGKTGSKWDLNERAADE